MTGKIPESGSPQQVPRTLETKPAQLPGASDPPSEAAASGQTNKPDIAEISTEAKMKSQVKQILMKVLQSTTYLQSVTSLRDIQGMSVNQMLNEL